ncbi:MAG: hypothetical protein OEV59_04695 [Deltaproteobacteria bacterium]|nr:hypothetical protein [Deltaproteobacteria bacterium]
MDIDILSSSIYDNKDFLKIISQIKKNISSSVPYIDKVVVWFKQYNSKIDKEELEKFCTKAITRKGLMHYYNKQKKRWLFNSKWSYRIILLQPKPELFVYLKQNTTQAYLISHFEEALDYITPDFESALTVHDFLQTFLVKKWHGKQELHCLINHKNKNKTTYFAKRGTPVNFVIYSGRNSKIRKNQPCCHLEIRFFGSSAVKNRLGITSFDDIINFNHYNFWKKYIRLYRISNITKLGKIFTKNKSKKTKARLRRKPKLKKHGHITINIDLLNARSVLHTATILKSNLRGYYRSMQALFDYAKILKKSRELRSVIEQIENTIFLPGQQKIL